MESVNFVYKDGTKSNSAERVGTYGTALHG